MRFRFRRTVRADIFICSGVVRMSINWPLNEPIKTKCGDDAVIYAIEDGLMFGRVGKGSASWNASGVCIMRDYDLIPPNPERQYGYAVWMDWRVIEAGQGEPRRRTGKPGSVVLYPIPFPGETTCVKPSPEDVQKIVDEHFSLGTTNKIPAAIMALLDGK